MKSDVLSKRASLGRLPSTRPEVCALFEYFFRKEEEIEAFSCIHTARLVHAGARRCCTGRYFALLLHALTFAY
jgi:hypothetical protein